MTELKKRVSILLSCFNGDDLVEGYIDALLESGHAETCVLVAVNFPASHVRPGFVERQLKRFPDLVLLDQTESLSLYEAWNIGITRATTEFVSNLNLDDRVTADYFRLALDHLDRRAADVFSSFSVATPRVGVKTGDSRAQDHLGPECFDDEGIACYGLSELAGFQNGRLVKRSIPHCAPVWRKQLHDDLGYFDSRRFDFAADYEFWLRCAAAGRKLIVSNEHKTLFYCSEGTASDRLQHPENREITDYWGSSFPPAGYRESHLGARHDELHHCLNLNCVFSSREYFNHHPGSLASIVVVAHDHPEWLLECLASIRAQSYPLFECIVVLDDDDRGDLRRSVAGQFSQDARFLAVGLSGRRERSYCRNLGMELATGNWVTIVDGDDLLPRDSLSARIDAARGHERDIVFGQMYFTSAGGVPERNEFSAAYSYEDLRYRWPGHCTLLIPRNRLSDTRYPASITDCVSDSSLLAGEDVRFMHELLKKNPGSRFINCGEHVYTYRRHLSTSFKNRHRSIQQVIDAILSYHGLPEPGDHPYRNRMSERAASYIYWLGLALWNGKMLDQLPLEADERILDLCRRAPPEPFDKAERQFVSEIGKLGLLARPEAARLAAAVRKALGVAPRDRRRLRGHADKAARPPNRYAPEKIDYQRLCRWKNIHAGGNCVLLCNGPSLNRVDFRKIDARSHVLFGLNKIFLGFENLDIRPRYIAAVNLKVLQQAAEVYRDLDIVKFLSNRISPAVLPQDPFTYFMNTADPPANAARFSTEVSEYVNEGWTVTHVALQLIYYMGFRNVYIVGMDHRFSQHVAGRENQPSVMHGEDVDHFHPEYFGHGKSWDLPDLENSETSYRSALAAFRADGRQIHDCTIDGACTVFPRLDIRSIYSAEAA